MIDEKQLSIWASAPNATKYRYTHEEIRKALNKYLPNEAFNKSGFKISNSDYEVYLQGSYANSTNIKEDSDVDVIVELKSLVFSYDVDDLTSEEKKEFHSTYPNPSKYKFEDFKRDVYNSLAIYFNNVEYSEKCLKIPGNTLRVNADIVPCFEHRKYEKFTYLTRNKFIPGIKFFNTNTQEKIINFPKKHIENCEAKNVDTEGNFKGTIRIFKHLNKELKEKNLVKDGEAPSYFIENMLYNCSPQVFNNSYTDIVLKVFQFLTNDIKNGRFEYYQCANEQDLLFSDKTWKQEQAVNFINLSANLFLNEV